MLDTAENHELRRSHTCDADSADEGAIQDVILGNRLAIIRRRII
jgi:hypothetical protein